MVNGAWTGGKLYHNHLSMSGRKEDNAQYSIPAENNSNPETNANNNAQPEGNANPSMRRVENQADVDMILTNINQPANNSISYSIS
jgi:hypothetical protein